MTRLSLLFSQIYYTISIQGVPYKVTTIRKSENTGKKLSMEIFKWFIRLVIYIHVKHFKIWYRKVSN